MTSTELASLRDIVSEWVREADLQALVLLPNDPAIVHRTNALAHWRR